MQTQGNNFVTTLYRTLVPHEDSTASDPSIVKGYVERILNKKDAIFVTQFAVLDKTTGILRFFSDPHSECLSVHNLRFARCLVDYQKNTHATYASTDGSQQARWPIAAKFFAIHSGSQVI